MCGGSRPDSIANCPGDYIATLMEVRAKVSNLPYFSAPRVNPRPLQRLLRDIPVVVTGMGAYCGAGTSVMELWQTVLRGESPADWLPAAVAPAGFRVAGIRAADPPSARLARKMDRSAQLALAAAAEAWRTAQLDKQRARPERTGIVVGTSRGAVGKLAESIPQAAANRARPSDAVHCSLANVSGMLSLAFPAHGSALTVTATCASGAVAIAMAAEQILLGHADVVLAGGTEAPLNPLVIAQLHAAGILGYAADPRLTCRPFDIARNGIVLGEGAGFLVLESLASAQRRGAPVIARLAGWALAAEGEARAGMAHSGASLSRVITEALTLADIAPPHLGYVNAHGTGTVLNDLAEANALHTALAEAAVRVPCSSTKAITGHCLGASAALEAIVAIQAMREGCLPGSANCAQPDPQVRLNLLRTATAATVNSALSLSAGFWGNQAALAFQPA